MVEVDIISNVSLVAIIYHFSAGDNEDLYGEKEDGHDIRTEYIHQYLGNHNQVRV
jgi:hypothetical protein